jgi:hypothetical protein
MENHGILSKIIQHLVDHSIEYLIGIGGTTFATYFAKVREKLGWSITFTIGLVVFATTLVIYDHLIGSNQQAKTVPLGWATYQKQQIVSKSFNNEKIIVDGKSFISCSFKNVTFEYNATAPFDIINSSLDGQLLLDTTSPPIATFILFLKEFNFINPKTQFIPK